MATTNKLIIPEGSKLTFKTHVVNRDEIVIQAIEFEGTRYALLEEQYSVTSIADQIVESEGVQYQVLISGTITVEGTIEAYVKATTTFEIEIDSDGRSLKEVGLGLEHMCIDDLGLEGAEFQDWELDDSDPECSDNQDIEISIDVLEWEK